MQQIGLSTVKLFNCILINKQGPGVSSCFFFFFAALSHNDKFEQLVGRDIAETTFQSRSGMI